MSNRKKPVVVGTGVEQHVATNPNLDPRYVAGEHSWVAIACFQLTDPTRPEFHLDRENLLSINIGCYWCEEPYADRMEHTVCPGDVDAVNITTFGET